MLPRPNFVAAEICRRCEATHITFPFTRIVGTSQFLRDRNPIYQSIPARRDAAGCFSHRENMADDELRKGQKDAAACVDLVYNI